MEIGFGLLVLMIPAAIVVLGRWVLRSQESLWRKLSWVIVAAIWALTAYLWADYSRQTDDVGLIAHGLLAFAVTGAALLTTIAFFLVARF